MIDVEIKIEDANSRIPRTAWMDPRTVGKDGRSYASDDFVS